MCYFFFLSWEISLVSQLLGTIKIMAILRSAEIFIRIAGVSGFLAVALGAYGSHGLRKRVLLGLRKRVDDKTYEVFQTANRYHFIHTLALLAVPMTRHPTVVGVLLFLGMLGFCGTCYYSALSGSKTLNKFTPYGGMVLMAGWLAMAF
ncbi:transmembrane protein 256 homolog isoform X2 [Patiria miniata]|uniref:Transmembrane protein 256 homolog n=1 Tax=Patiria miniata TaxID=46514 RepID=A0A913ZI04_PATMI|nr:transmembrane protein 256 homolog isoform X2 [Patiria miniata]